MSTMRREIQKIEWCYRQNKPFTPQFLALMNIMAEQIEHQQRIINQLMSEADHGRRTSKKIEPQQRMES